MKTNKKFENRSTLYALIVIAVFFLIVGAAQKCNGQMTIPMVKGTVEEGNILTIGGGSGDKFFLYESTMDATSTDVKIEFRYRKHERPNELNYMIDSLDISESMQDGYEKITLWVNNDVYPDYTEKIVIFTNGNAYRMYIYYTQEIFYFSGKVH